MSTEQRSEPPRSGRFMAIYAVAVLAVFYMFAMMSRSVANLLIEQIKGSLALDDIEASVVLGPAFGLTYALCGLPLGWLGDRFSRRWTIFLGTVVWALAALLSGFARSYEHMVLARAFVGFGEAALLPSAYALIAQAVPRQRLSLALSIMFMGTVGGTALAYGSGNLLGGLASHLAGAMSGPLGGLESWRWMLILTALPLFPVAPLVLGITERRTPPQPGLKPASAAAFLASSWRPAIAIAGGIGVVGLIGSGIMAWSVAHMQRVLHVSLAQAGATLSLLSLFLTSAGKIGSGLLVDKLIARGVKDAALRYLIFGLVISAPLALVAFHTSSYLTFVICLAPFFALSVPTLGVGSALMMMITPVEIRSTVSAALMLVINVLAQSGGPLVPGWLAQKVFHGEGAMGAALFTVVAVGAPLSILLMWQGLGATRRAVEAQEATL